MILGNITKSNPKEIGLEIGNILKELNLVSSIEVAGPGFINIFLNHSGTLKIIKDILDKNTIKEEEDSKKIQVEFVSANPTGPLHVGHGRGAIYGDVISKLLEKKGHKVQKEYYVNDAGRQIDILTASVYLRAINIEDNIFPESAYRGEYIKEIAKNANLQEVVNIDDLFKNLPKDKEEKIDEIISHLKSACEKDWQSIKKISLESVLSTIEKDLEDFGVTFDNWFLESSLLGADSKIDAAVQQLNTNNLIDNRDGNIWFKSSDFGDDKDRVLIRADGRQTYFASDVAYHKFKFDRKFDHLVNIWGADHHGYIPRIKGALDALGLKGDLLKTIIIQFVSLNRSGKTVSMSTRKGDFVSLNELIDEVGIDASRFFFLARKSDQALEFDVELALKKDKNNPVYYIQYAHARICSLLKEVEKRDFVIDSENGLKNLNLITGEQELSLINEIELFQDTLEQCQIDLEIHPLCFYLRDLASKFHSYYNANKFIEEEKNLRDAKFAIVLSIKRIITEGLNILAINAPEQM